MLSNGIDLNDFKIKCTNWTDHFREFFSPPNPRKNGIKKGRNTEACICSELSPIVISRLGHLFYHLCPQNLSPWTFWGQVQSPLPVIDRDHFTSDQPQAPILTSTTDCRIARRCSAWQLASQHMVQARAVWWSTFEWKLRELDYFSEMLNCWLGEFTAAEETSTYQVSQVSVIAKRYAEYISVCDLLNLSVAAVEPKP